MTCHIIGGIYLAVVGVATSLAGSTFLQGNPIAVEGAVYDSVSGAPIPFAVVSAQGTSRSTLTSRDGRFRITLEPGDWLLEARKIGYRMSVASVRIGREGVHQDLYLTPLPFELETVEVTARGENLATRIMREAIARKRDVLARLHDYRYDAYVKFLVRDLAKNPDSTESVFVITETQTMAYWEQPDRYQEVITARRQSSNLEAENNLVSVGQIVNFNRNRIDLEKYSVVSPTADDALEHYDYHVLDTLVMNGRRVFRLAIEPRSTSSPLFVGMIDIADSTFDVVSIDVGANEAVRFEFFKNLRYRQHLEDFGDGFWMPREIRFSGELHVGIPLPGFPEHVTFVHIASLRDYRFDEGAPPAYLGEYVVVVDDGADDADSTFWEESRSIPLSQTERAAYQRIDSLQNRPQPLTSQLLTGTIGVLFLTANADFFHFNRVEGAYVGGGVTLRDLSPDVVVRAKLGHAFLADLWQQDFGVQYRVDERRRVWLGAGYRDEVVARPAVVSGARNSTHLALLARLDPLDYYREKGFSVFMSTRVVNFTQFQIQYNHFRQSSLPVVTDYALFNPNRAQRPNPPVTDGRLRSISASFRFDSRRLLKRKGRDFFLNEFTYSRIILGAELASPTLQSDFDFFRYFVRIHHRQRTLNMGLTTVEAAAGGSTGRLPPQRYFTIDFGKGAFFESQGFNTLSETNFSGNRMAMIFVNHDFDQQLFRRSGIPLIRNIPFTVSVHGGAFWTHFVDHEVNPGDELVRTAPSAYSELGFGIGNLTPFLSPFNFAAWFTWQLSAYDTGGFNVSFGVPAQ